MYNLYTTGRTASAIDLASIVEVFCLIWLFYLQHTHSPTPLAFLSIYLTLDIVFKAAALWISDRRTSVLGGFECLLAESFYIKMVLLVLHEQSTWNTMKRQFKLKLGREATYGFWSRVFGIPLASSLLRAQNWTAPQMTELDDTPISKELEASFYDAWHRCKNYMSVAYVSHLTLIRRRSPVWLTALMCSYHGMASRVYDPCQRPSDCDYYDHSILDRFHCTSC